MIKRKGDTKTKRDGVMLLVNELAEYLPSIDHRVKGAKHRQAVQVANKVLAGKATRKSLAYALGVATVEGRLSIFRK